MVRPQMFQRSRRLLFSSTSYARLNINTRLPTYSTQFSTSSYPEILNRIKAHGMNNNQTAIVENGQEDYQYHHLVSSMKKMNDLLIKQYGITQGSRVAFLCPPGFEYCSILCAIWESGGVAIPLCVSHPRKELEYCIEECDADIILSVNSTSHILAPIAESLQRNLCIMDISSLNTEDEESSSSTSTTNDCGVSSSVSLNDDALIIFTSGTTGMPKGVVLTHGNLQSQTKTLVDAWKWSKDDRILHILPLHHLHGLGNKLLCALYSGASILFCSPKPKEVWEMFSRAQELKITLFMAVPTNYALLLKEYSNVIEHETVYSQQIQHGLKNIRLMVSGSMSMPTPLLRKWEKITGHHLLERYGMSELGMVLSQPLAVEERVPGTVGKPLPGVQVKVVMTSTDDCSTIEESGDSVNNLEGESTGELYVRGDSVFNRYFRKEEETKQAFTSDGAWFKTGDMVSLDKNSGIYRMLGRASVDIIKSKGYKVSALEIERVLLAFDHIVSEVAVVGVPDETYGQIIAAVVVLSSHDNFTTTDQNTDMSLNHEKVEDDNIENENTSQSSNTPLQLIEQVTLQKLRTLAQEELAHYKLPTVIKIVNVIPKNAMGKINKKDLLAFF